MHSSFLDDLRSITDVLAEPDALVRYGQDWSGIVAPAPCAVALPREAREIAEILRLCARHAKPVVPSGGRTGLSGGATADAGELVLSLEKMNRLGPVDAASRTLRAQAGVVTQAVHEHCAPHGLTWPVDFASKGSSQVGGNLSTNAGGVRVIRYGNTRQWVLSVELVTMSGEILELGGDLEKNNTGYDLRQLVIGAEGTLGVISAATLKLAPIPPEPRIAFFGMESMESVIRLFASARRGPFELCAFECLDRASYSRSVAHLGTAPPVDPAAAAFVLLEAECATGRESAFDAWLESVFADGLALSGTLASSPAQGKELWRIREAVAESVLAGSVVHQHDVSVPVAALPEFSRAISRKYADDYPELEVFIFGHIGDGNLHVFLRKPDSQPKEAFLKRCKESDEALFRFIQNFRGSVSAEHGIGRLKKHALPFSRGPAEIEIFRGIKRAFDPLGLMNPGKLF